ncbi:MAG: (d)CMP kinase, partial [Deltaproteobacteria bacterium]
PMPECVEIKDAVKKLLGKRIVNGFSNEVKNAIGKTNGCLHITNLILAMASASVQGAWSYYSRIRENENVKRPSNDGAMVIDSCWMWREDGPLAERFYSSEEKTFVVAIDGPAGAGKSSVSKALAKKLSFAYLDTGALYRAFAFKLIKEKICPTDIKKITEMCQTTKIEIKSIANNERIYIDGNDVTEFIRSEEVGLMASTASALPEVRLALLGLQRRFAFGKQIVAEGRDMGSVVFPSAQVKIFLVADEKERARRRHLELETKGIKESVQTVLTSIKKRDEQDTNREIAPLQPTTDAIIIDSSNMSIDDVVNKIAEICVSK